MRNKSKHISMKKLYQWASEFPQWKKKPENNHGTSDFSISIGMSYIIDFLDMIWDKRRE